MLTVSFPVGRIYPPSPRDLVSARGARWLLKPLQEQSNGEVQQRFVILNRDSEPRVFQYRCNSVEEARHAMSTSHGLWP